MGFDINSKLKSYTWQRFDSGSVRTLWQNSFAKRLIR